MTKCCGSCWHVNTPALATHPRSSLSPALPAHAACCTLARSQKSRHFVTEGHSRKVTASRPLNWAGPAQCQAGRCYWCLHACEVHAAVRALLMRCADVRWPWSSSSLPVLLTGGAVQRLFFRDVFCVGRLKSPQQPRICSRTLKGCSDSISVLSGRQPDPFYYC